jgi:hypothetical protein
MVWHLEGGFAANNLLCGHSAPGLSGWIELMRQIYRFRDERRIDRCNTEIKRRNDKHSQTASLYDVINFWSNDLNDVI